MKIFAFWWLLTKIYYSLYYTGTLCNVHIGVDHNFPQKFLLDKYCEHVSTIHFVSHANTSRGNDRPTLGH